MDYFDIYMDYFDIYIEYSAARMGAGILGIWGQKNGFTENFFLCKAIPLYTSSYMESNVSNNTSSSVRFSNQSVYPDREKKIYFDILYLGDISFPRLVSVS